MDSMSKRVRIAASPLKVLATNEAAVDVDIGERHRTDFFEVKIQNGSVDLEHCLDNVSDENM